MKRDIYNWDTTHETVDKTMIHHFVQEVELIIDWGMKQMAFIYKNRVIDRFSFPKDYSVSDHTKVAYRTSAIANARYPLERLFGFRRNRLKRLAGKIY